MYVISFDDVDGGWMYAAYRDETHQFGFVNDLNQAIIFVSIKEAIDWWNHHMPDFDFAGIPNNPAIRKLVAKVKVGLKPYRSTDEVSEDESA